MSEHSGFASLTGSLLARKGTARPAMRSPLHLRGSHAGMGSEGLSAVSGHDDLGWNDMHGEPVNVEAQAPVHVPQPTVAQLQQAISDRLAHVADRAAADAAQAPAPVLPEKRSRTARVAAPVCAQPEMAPVQAEVAPAQAEAPAAPATLAEVPVRQSALATGRRAAFTLRLDADRHLKLRLACTMHGRSAQMLITEALDRLLAEEPALCALAAQMPNRS